MADLLDTNVLSELRKPTPASVVLAYFENRAVHERLISMVSIAEIRFGIRLARDVLKREDIRAWLDDVLLPLFKGQVVGVSEEVLLRWRILIEDGRKSGRTYSQPDLLIAATAPEHNLTLVTRNTRDFADIPGLQLLNPWEESL